jgi:hypothetical protein
MIPAHAISLQLEPIATSNELNLGGVAELIPVEDSERSRKYTYTTVLVHSYYDEHEGPKMEF